MKRHVPHPLRLLKARLRTGLAAFASEARGTVAIESMIMLPVVVWTYLAMFSFFDMLRMRSVTQKATFTVADAYSRETAEINNTYVNGSFELYKALVRDNNPRMRVSVLTYDGSTRRYVVRWSKTRGTGVTAMTDSAANNMRTQLPNIASGDEFLIVETWNSYAIPFKIGMTDFEMKSLVFMNPRFAGQLKWQS